MEFSKIAKRIVNTNVGIKEKDTVIISAGPKSLDFAEALSYECAKIGAQSMITYGSDKLSLKVYKSIKTKFLKNRPRLSELLYKNIDVSIHIDESDPFLERQLPQRKVQLRQKTFKPIRDIMDRRIKQRKLKTGLVGFPTKEGAKALGVPFNKLKRIYFAAINTDYNKLYSYTYKLSKKFVGKDKIRIIGERTDLEFSIKNREPLIATGLLSKEKIPYINLPDGEVYFAPVETSANGEIYFDLPCLWHYGKKVHGVWFKFKNGKVVNYKIKKGLKAFESIMKNASGDKFRMAELGIGTNPNAKPSGGMTIIDEKIRGTIHIAIGHNKHFGGKNDSTIHWDFFKDMRKGEVLVDNKLVMKNGKWLI